MIGKTFSQTFSQTFALLFSSKLLPFAKWTFQVNQKMAFFRFTMLFFSIQFKHFLIFLSVLCYKVNVLLLVKGTIYSNKLLQTVFHFLKEFFYAFKCFISQWSKRPVASSWLVGEFSNHLAYTGFSQYLVTFQMHVKCIDQN